MSESTLAEEQLAADASTSTFVSALIFNAALGGAYLLAFCILRPTNRNLYAPRTYMPPPSKQSPALSKNWLGWVPAMFRWNEEEVIRRNGLDAYVFLRYLFVSMRLFTLFALLGLAVLLPLNVTGGGSNVGLNSFNMGNIADPDRLWAHLVLGVLFVVLVCWAMHRELVHYLSLRHRYLLSPGYRERVQARSLLVKEVPLELVSELENLFSVFGPVEHVQVVQNVAKVSKLMSLRDTTVSKLEEVECEYVRTGERPTVKVLPLKALSRASTSKSGSTDKQKKKLGEETSDDDDDEEEESIKQLEKKMQESAQRQMAAANEQQQQQQEQPQGARRLTSAASSLAANLKPKSVDAIEMFKEKLLAAEEALAKSRARVLSRDPKRPRRRRLNLPLSYKAAFITFKHQLDAHIAGQAVVGTAAFRLTDRWPEVHPDDVLWYNVNVCGPNRVWRKVASILMSLALIIVWSIIVTFVSSIATLNNLVSVLTFLEPIKRWPEAVVGIIQGIIPAVALATLMALLPIILTALSRFEGIPLNTAVSLAVIHKYYLFLIVNVLLVVTFATGIFSALDGLSRNPASAINILAENMPKASTFFLTYVLLLAFTAPAQGLLMLVPMIKKWIFRRFLWTSKSPHGIMSAKAMPEFDWSTAFPQQVLIFAIGMTYSVIAPLVLPLVAIYFFNHYVAYSYQLLYVYDQSRSSSLGGRAYPRAIYHTFVGLYIFELTLLGLFLLQKAIPQVVIVVLLIIGTAVMNRALDKGFQDVNKWLPTETAVMMAKKNADIKLTSKKELSQPEQQDASLASVESTPRDITAAPDTEISVAIKELDAAIVPVADPGPSGKKKLTLAVHAGGNKSTVSLASHLSHSVPTDQAYLHPSLYVPARPIWIPSDMAGLAQQQVEYLREAGISATCAGAAITAEGRIIVDARRVPEWYRYDPENEDTSPMNLESKGILERSFGKMKRVMTDKSKKSTGDQTKPSSAQDAQPVQDTPPDTGHADSQVEHISSL